MTRLLILVEGDTEETFVRTLLAPHLGMFNVFAVSRKIEVSRDSAKIYRGGLIDYHRVERDLRRWMTEDQNPDAHFTTMFDLYALPNDFPDYDNAKRTSEPYRRVEILEYALKANMGHPRFIPYIQLYEFEALLFSDIQHFDWEFLEHEMAIKELMRIADEFENPELINDGVETAPSKRIVKLIPEYKRQKSSAGPLIAQKIGLSTIRRKCQHFHKWLIQLEQLGKTITN